MPDSPFRSLLATAYARRKTFTERADVAAYRIFSGLADGVDGVFVDVYGPGAVMNVYEGRPPRWFDAEAEAETVRAVAGVRAVYVKPFVRDRSRLGGELPDIVTRPASAAGEMLDEFLLVREHAWQLEVRLYDGLSTGLFLDQRDNRLFLSRWCAERKRSAPDAPPAAVLNTFAYTCAFSVAAAHGGAITTSVDVSGRYLDWGKRNFGHNALDPAAHRFAKMDTFEFMAYARRKNLRYDAIVLDPPSFASGSKKKGFKPWSSISDYARLIHESAGLLNPRGILFASTNTQALCRPGRFEREIATGLGRTPGWIELPETPEDFAQEMDRITARAFFVR